MRNIVILFTLVTATVVYVTQDARQLNLVPSQFSMSLRRGNTDILMATCEGCVSSDSTQHAHNNSTFCSLVKDTLASHTPSQWWMTHFDDILNASQHPQDPNGVYRNWTLKLLASLTPEMLQRGVRDRPSNHAFQRITHVLHKRITDPLHSPPLKVVVLGGSVTRGNGCQEPILRGTEPLDATSCAWPSRLENLINALAGMEVVKVYNLAVGATNLQFATPLVKYWLYPKDLLPSGPDIIISSHSTNEQPNRHEDTTKSNEYANRELIRVQEFITTSRLARPCNPPLVMFVDDYLGNRQNFILGEMTYNKVVTELSEWYGEVMHVSYADVIRQAIYADTSETTFSKPWPLQKSGKFRGLPKVDVHFGMAGHVAIAWSILYAMVDVTSGYCDNEDFVLQVKEQGVFSTAVMDLVNAIPPPELNPSLLLQNISVGWQENAVRMHKSQAECNSKVGSKLPCEFAFLAGPGGAVGNPKELRDYLRPFLFQNKGWKPEMDLSTHGHVEKPGLVATKANASLILRLINIEKEIQVINLQYIKSYGAKWMGSRARFSVHVEDAGGGVYNTSFDVKGNHQAKVR